MERPSTPGDLDPRPDANLHRTFSELSVSGVDDGPATVLRGLRAVDGSVQDWDWLLDAPLSVVIADGGAGKTFEMQAQVRRLRERGQPAFFLAIERLCSTDFRAALPSGEDAETFARWLRQGDAAVLLLDSVDEAKLPTAVGVNPLQSALRRVEEALGERIHQCRFVISSRPSAWNPDIELKEAQRVSRRLKAAAGATPGLVRVVRLDHLTPEQIDLLARSKGAGDEFLDVIRETGAMDFAQYPLDILDQVEAYKEALRTGESVRAPFRSLTAILDRAIARRAHEFSSASPRSAIDPDRIISGAKRLALALMLQQTQIIRMPGQAGEGLDPAAALQGGQFGWSRPDLESLLATGLFEPAWQGASRFHHRRTQERLAAMALRDLRRAGCSAQSIFDLLLPQSFEVRTTPAAYIDAAGWLCALDPDFAALVAPVAPEILMERGDPGALPMLLRVEVVRRHADRYRSHHRRGHWFDTTLLSRFADDELADVLAEVLGDALPDEPRSHALLMARAGKLTSLSALALGIAVDPHESAELRSYAVLALSEIGVDSERRALADVVRRSAAGSMRSRQQDPDYARTERNRLKVWTVEACYPAALSTPELLEILRTLEPRNRENIDELGRVLRRAIVPHLLKGELASFAQDVSAISWARTDWRLGTTEIASWSDVGWYLLPVLQDVIVRVIEECPEAAEEDWLTVEVDRLWSAGNVTLGPLNTTHKLDAERLGEAVRANVRFRRLFFWAVASAQKEHGPVHALHRLRRVYRDRGREDAPVRAADLQWLREDLFSGVEALQAPALDAVSSALARHGEGRRRATAAILLTSLRHRRLDVVARLRWRPFQRLWWRLKYWREFNPQRWRYRWTRLRREHWPRWRVKTELLLHRREVRDGKRPDLVWKAAFSHGGDSPFDQVAKRLGNRIAGDLRTAARAFIRREPLPKEKRWDVELARQGWRLMAAEAPDQLLQISDDAMRNLVRSSLREHEWPPYATVIATRPEIWREVAEPRVRGDLARRGALSDNFGRTLYKVAYGEAALQRPLAFVVVDAIESLRAPTEDQIRNAARVAASERNARQAFAALALRRASEHFAEARVAAGAIWWTEAFRAEPRAAWDVLDRWRRLQWSSSPTLIYPLYAALGEAVGRFAHRGADDAAPGPQLLADLAVLGRQVVSPSEDERLDGWVSPRHHAQDLRESVLRQLAEDPSKEARDALASLAAASEFADSADWIAIMLRQQAEAASRPKPWSIEDIVDYCRVWSRAPRTTGDLYQLLVALIRAIELDLETSEFDRRAAFRVMSERTLRAWIGEELRRRSNGWFSVTQETVTANENRMDLRCETAGGDAICVIELKIAGPSWRCMTLFEHLEKQLADQYLISRRVRSGIYLIADLRQKFTFDTPSGKSDYEGLIANLKLHGEEVRTMRPMIEDLGVMSFSVNVPPVATRKRR